MFLALGQPQLTFVKSRMLDMLRPISVANGPWTADRLLLVVGWACTLGGWVVTRAAKLDTELFGALL